ncbi:MAG TPA: c-type cytochrome [Gemmataceae bacterium]|nr:c-type cytochrome [Gemmataceae bacterium]
MTFRVLYEQNCVACHGADGRMGPAPPLNDPLFLALVPDAELQRVIREGRSGTPMPAFAGAQGGPLTAEQVQVLAEGIKQRWVSREPAPKGAPSYLVAGSGSDDGGNKEKGMQVFAQACASCHGDRGQGGRHRGQADGKPVGAINDADFLALISDQALRRYVITGRSDLGMPNYADPRGRSDGFQPLTSQDVADVVALLAYWRQSGSINEKGR